MRSSSIRGAIALLAVTMSIGVAGTTAVAPAGAQSGADLVEACEPLSEVPEVGPRTCKSVQAGTYLGAQTCRRVPGTEEALCPSIDGREVHEPAMQAFEASWLARALDLQRELDRDVPLVDALLPHTHNSANSAAYPPSVSTLDANQAVTLTDQLRLGMRAVEIDVHWTPHPGGDPEHGFREAVQCHGEPVDTGTPLGTVHAGCSVDRTLQENLAELRAWIDRPENADELVLLYLENVLDDDEAAHARAVEAIDQELGDLVFRPTAGAGCQDLPVRTESKGSILATGARVLITGNCGPGGWNDRVFQRGSAWSESGSNTDYECTADRQGTDYATTLVRRYEDSTWLSAMAGAGSHITTEVLADMVRCGVNLPGLDQVHAGDERLASLVWSWRADQPAAGTAGACAAQGTDARFGAAECSALRPVACRTTDGSWAVTTEAVAWALADLECAAEGHAGAGVPVNGWDNGLLRSAADTAGADEVWLAYAQDVDGRWVTGVPEVPQPEAEPQADPRAGRGHGGKPTEPGPPAGAGSDAATPIDGEPVVFGADDVPAGVATVLVAAVAAGAAFAERRHRRRRRR